jgi:hypothetical protein
MMHAKRIRTVVSGALLAVSALVASTAPALAGGPSTGYTGRWVAIDCATWWEEPHVVDCGVWGDGSAMTLTIGPGGAPVVTYQDALASVCANNGSPATRWVAAGVGTYEDIYLFVDFGKSGCGRFGMGGYGTQLYHDPGSDTIWEDADGDGWGTVWYRAP